ncbi:MAG: hypothetical protein ACI353_07305 [Alloprevotella sp.]
MQYLHPRRWAALLFVMCGLAYPLSTQASAPESSRPESATAADSARSTQRQTPQKEKPRRGLTIGGYGEAVMSRNFYSDSYLRYTNAESKRDAKSHGRFDLPHVVFYIAYDFGHGWSMGSEIEFEHGGTESAMEIEEEEAGEYETEVERGGEVALEQFWLQKSFCPQLNIRAGHIIVPVGQTNNHHMPTEFFGVYRPEGENTLLPCTWHETGISVWGQTRLWNQGSRLRYELLFLPGLDSERFNSQNWIQGGSASPYEFKIGNTYAFAGRLDFTPVPGLTISASGYVGDSFRNTLRETDNSSLAGVKGRVSIGSFDFRLDKMGWKVRGVFDYGHLSDAAAITQFNRSLPKASPSPRQPVASDAYVLGLEAGYDMFRLCRKLRESGQQLYLFGRYDAYDSMHKMENTATPYEWCGRQRVAVGLNYRPLRDIVVKAEYACGLLKRQYNNEPSISLGIAYAGFFR